MRDDPNDSFSDWTIEVTTEDNDDIVIYHVHRNFLCAGKHRSEYLERLFKMKQAIEKLQNSTSKISLIDSAAVFSWDVGFRIIASATLIAKMLLFLAKYFGIRILHDTLQEFIQQNLTPSSAQNYLLEAFLYHDTKMVDRT